ncbi:unnamed protein product [Clavelina lepadiformis]|uniref:Uncharacterized protein n=1 Tax=Clavelina lepadiformis TaxID=159417 RepID=A0ABP0F353_CLALP
MHVGSRTQLGGFITPRTFALIFGSISLPEDFGFSGFASLSQTEHEPQFSLITECTSPQQRVKAFNCIHLDFSRHIVEYLCEMKQPTTCIQARMILEDDAKLQDTESEEETRQDDDLFQLRALCDSLKKEKLKHKKRKIPNTGLTTTW